MGVGNAVEAWKLRFGDHLAVEPGFQYYSQPGKIGRFSSWNDQDNRIGPQLSPSRVRWTDRVPVPFEEVKKITDNSPTLATPRLKSPHGPGTIRPHERIRILCFDGPNFKRPLL